MTDMNDKAIMIVEMLQRGAWLTHDDVDTLEMLTEFVEEILNRGVDNEI